MNGLNILVIDDEHPARELLRRMLEKDGHSVVTAGSGQEGISIFEAALSRQKPFDLVITDFGMPQMNGGQVAKAIKSLSPSTPVILLSGWDSRSSADAETLSVIDCLLDKPTTGQELRLAIKKVIAQRSHIAKL
ncbi:response regulator [Fervidibacter sacchari]|uniref:CheY-like chemotaxis protein n=1 Tax=Candidatus Fervidibacter sacchari TaxID=1448929 RepID=A0ABT2EQ55_9BACT|nr:response regulator [Candidatus Fervidibacter sacchari]MCS3920092.1 CheY-like chemotaxis protein [Candidatus Fervidibacter sacchari]WKU16677.1 response regulator [Candidatus Fervidibacter sacchari]